MRDPPNLPSPPGPPGLPRRVRLYRPQWIGLPLLILIPVLALFDVFGAARDRTEASGEEVHNAVEYPTRLRLGQRAEIEVRVRNLTGRVLDTVTISFDTAYLGRFGDVAFAPEPARAYVVRLERLGPARSELVRVELEGRQAWRHGGWIVGGAGTADPVRVRIETFVFP